MIAIFFRFLSFIPYGNISNLKTAAKTLIVLQENGLDDLAEFDRRYADCNTRYDKAEADLQLTDKQIRAFEQMQKHLRNYGKTKELYGQFQSSKNKDKFLRDNPDAERAVMMHEAAKQYFDGYKKQSNKPLPTSKFCSERLAELRPLQEQQSKEFEIVRNEQRELMRLKANLQTMLGRDNPKSKSTEVSL